ncbi:hypothetical protein [Sphingomonas sp. VNH70]|uniref:hypothetical protein n=1 Tax=Sphingomonas silueang TaxID=3156617 RepID=UPI0032B33474
MSNVRAAPAWLTGAVVDRVQAGIDQAVSRRALRQIGLTYDEIVQVERIAAVRAVRPEVAAADMIRAAIVAVECGGWEVRPCAG